MNLTCYWRSLFARPLWGACLCILVLSSLAVGCELYPTTVPIWSKEMGSPYNDCGQAVVSDGEGNVIVSGYFQRAMSFGGPTVETLLPEFSNYSTFLAKYSPDGEHIWSRALVNRERTLPGRFNPEKLFLAAGPDGSIAVAGYFKDTINLGGDDLIAAAEDAFIALFDSQGTPLWSKQFGGPESDRITSVAIDGNGDVLITGFFHDVVSFGGDALSSQGGSDIFLARFTAEGAHVWSKRLGGSMDDLAEALAVSSGGELAIVGGFRGTVDFGGGDLVARSSENPEVDRETTFIGRYSGNGEYVWARSFELSDGYQRHSWIAWDPKGISLVVNAPGLDSQGGRSLAKFSFDGTSIWPTNMTGGGGLAIDECGRIRLLSRRRSLADLSGTLPITEFEMTTLSPHGELIERTTLDGATNVYGEDITMDPSGRILITGCRVATLNGDLEDVYLAKIKYNP